MKRARFDVAQVGGEIVEHEPIECSTAQFDSLAHKLTQHAKRYRHNVTLKGRLVSSAAWNAEASFEEDVQSEINTDRSLYASVHAISESFPDAECKSFDDKLVEKFNRGNLDTLRFFSNYKDKGPALIKLLFDRMSDDQVAFVVEQLVDAKDAAMLKQLKMGFILMGEANYWTQRFNRSKAACYLYERINAPERVNLTQFAELVTRRKNILEWKNPKESTLPEGISLTIKDGSEAYHFLGHNFFLYKETGKTSKGAVQLHVGEIKTEGPNYMKLNYAILPFTAKPTDICLAEPFLLRIDRKSRTLWAAHLPTKPAEFVKVFTWESRFEVVIGDVMDNGNFRNAAERDLLVLVKLKANANGVKEEFPSFLGVPDLVYNPFKEAGDSVVLKVNLNLNNGKVKRTIENGVEVPQFERAFGQKKIRQNEAQSQLPPTVTLSPIKTYASGMLVTGDWETGWYSGFWTMSDFGGLVYGAANAKSVKLDVFDLKSGRVTFSSNLHNGKKGLVNRFYSSMLGQSDLLYTVESEGFDQNDIQGTATNRKNTDESKTSTYYRLKNIQHLKDSADLLDNRCTLNKPKAFAEFHSIVFFLDKKKGGHMRRVLGTDADLKKSAPSICKSISTKTFATSRLVEVQEPSKSTEVTKYRISCDAPLNWNM